MTDSRLTLAGFFAVVSVATAQAGGLPEAPPASVPEPAPLEVAELAARQPDATWLLDRLAPLGTGPGNAAEFLAALRPGAPGHVELEAALRRAGEADLGLDRGPALPTGDPLLLAAAGWMNQARCAFFEGAVPFEGWGTWRPDEELVLLFARSWAAEARATNSPEPARRAARLGRMLLQEQSWGDVSLAGHRAVLLGVNELRRQAVAEHRWADAIAALTASRRAQELWLRARSQARWRERSLSRTFAIGPHLASPLNVAQFEDGLAGGGTDRLDDVFFLWQVSGDARLDEDLRSQAASLLARWSKRQDPVVAGAAGWCARNEWSREAASLGARPPEDLAHARRSPADPIEGWLLREVPQCADHVPPTRLEADRRPAASPAEPPPELASLDGAGTRAVLDRLEWWDRAKGVRWQVLPVEDPFLLAYEEWLLGGAGALPEPRDRRAEGERQRLEALAWRSLVARLGRLAGSPEADRAAGAARRVAERDGDANWWLGWKWAFLYEALAWHELAAGRPEAALAAAHDALASRLSWHWQMELTAVVDEIEGRPLHRGFFGFGPARAPIEDADLEVLRVLASERCEHHVRVRAADGLFFVAHVGTWSQRRQAKQLLADLTDDDDAELAAHAAELLDREFKEGRRDLDTELADAAGEVEDTLRSWFGD